MTKTQRKPWSKKKKIIVIVLSVLLALFVMVIGAGLYALNWYCTVPEYEISSVSAGTEVSLIAHRGFSAVAPENTDVAYDEAGKAGFWGAECDVYRTADGVWVLSHDSITYRMMDKTAFVEKKTYDELKEFNTDNGTNIENYPDLKICTLKDYLNKCVRYDMMAVIELKSKNGTEHYDEILSLVEKTGANAMFISFNIENLQAIRVLDKSVPVRYLKHTIKEEHIAQVKALGGDCGISFNGNKEKNTPQIIQQCINQGLELGAWTIDDTEVLEKLLDMGVKQITTNSITY